MDDLIDKHKLLMKILLEFKHLILFLDANFSKEFKKNLKKLFPEFQSNLQLCLEMYKENLYNDDDDHFSKFLKQQENIFGSNEKLFTIDRFGDIKCNSAKLTKNNKNNPNIKPGLNSNNNDILDKSTGEILIAGIQNNIKGQRLADISGNKKSIVSKAKKVLNETKSRRKSVPPKKYVSRIVSSEESDEDSDNSDTDDSFIVKEVNSKSRLSKNVVKEFSSEESEEDNSDADLNNELFGISIEYSCLQENCKFKCTSSAQLRAHEIRSHVKQILKCLESGCDQEFESTDELNRHVLQDHGLYKCTNEKCNIIFPNGYRLKMHIKENHKKDYLTCKLCDKSYKTRIHLKKHIRVIHVEGEYKCQHENCNYIAKFRKDLTNHKLAKHLLKVCPFPGCELMVPHYRLKRHMSIHNKVKNYSCSWPDCGKSFNASKSLKDHVRLHLNFKRFKCKWPDCVYACEQKSNLITHIRVRHFKLPQTIKKQLEMKISLDSFPDPFDFIEVCSEDIRI